MRRQSSSLMNTSKFYKGHAIQRRLRDRMKEADLDAADRQGEKDEIEVIRQRLIEDGHPDIETEIAKIEEESERHMTHQWRIHIDSPGSASPEASASNGSLHTQEPEVSASNGDTASPAGGTAEPPETTSPVSDGNISSPDHDDGAGVHDDISDDGVDTEEPGGDPTPDQGQDKFDGADAMPSTSKEFLPPKAKLEFEIRSRGTSRKSQPGPQSKPPNPVVDKKHTMKKLVENIPTTKEKLFPYKIDWSCVNEALISRRIRPWINKKFVDYIGEEEPSLTDFVCNSVLNKTSPEKLLEDIAMVLDEEAEVFVVKMWRLLIYEVEANKAGLTPK